MTHVLSKTTSDESKSVFSKMVADYHRYTCEIAVGDRLETAKNEAKKYYEEANNIEMNPCSAAKLGLALNYSVFYYEVLKDRQQACKYADTALNSALSKIDELGENEFRDAKSIIEMIKENLNLWQMEEAGNQIAQEDA